MELAVPILLIPMQAWKRQKNILFRNIWTETEADSLEFPKITSPTNPESQFIKYRTIGKKIKRRFRKDGTMKVNTNLLTTENDEIRMLLY